jgi:Protein of unknown function (DUF1553)/Protein of unknown function (DUF1549)/Planctomycete cytochrome C
MFSHRIVFGISLAFSAGISAEPLGFNRDIRPILSKSCFACHGPDAAHGRKGELRLDNREEALKGGESGEAAIVPGKSADSELIRRITSTDADMMMPPPDSHFEISVQDRETLARWINEGAEYQDHWAFVAPVKAEVPAGVHPVDHWVNEGLKRQKFAPATEADKRTLIRRVTQDLTGLPPSVAEVEAFVDDASAQAYEKLVDRLLASPRFGEHFAATWLDAARYADTNGFSIDGGRQQWIWRDWVIHSFNTNQPYDQFLTDQLAGDLLPNATENQLVATGFNRNHSITHEGGTIPEENLVNYVADRVKTTSETFLGLTVACAQCHDHKYDPVSIREYYQFFAFFNTLDDKGLDGDAGRNAKPVIQASSVFADPNEAEKVRFELEKLRAEYAKPLPEAQAAWERTQREDLAMRGRDLTLQTLEIISVSSPNGDPERLQIQPDRSVKVRGGDFSAYNMLTKLPTAGPPITAIRLLFLPGDNGKLGYGKGEFEGNFHLGNAPLSVSTFPAENIDLNATLAIRRISASSSQAGHPPENIRNSDPLVGWVPATGSTTPQHITLTLSTPLIPGETPYLTTELLFNRGGGASPARFQILALTGYDDGSPHPADVTEILSADSSLRTEDQRKRLTEYFHSVGGEKALIRHQIRNLEERLAVLTEKHPVLVMNTAAKPRVTHVLDRGLYSSPMEAVTPGTPAALPPLAISADFDPASGSFKDRPANRLDLARWMVRDDHPLTARVAVNRLWEHFFGKALSAVSADIGSQGQWPSHPELLDWLAVDFRENGWDRKRMIKLLVTSAAYRRSSDATAEQLAKDPRNEWLARGSRFRLTAEQIRDQALAFAGLLVPRIGGPSVNPYQPGDMWRKVSHYGSSPATSQTFVQDHGEKLHRRSLYTYWKRTLPPVNLSVFDAPNREVCSIGRIPTNTPLQALVTLNDTQYVEAARAFAQRMLEENHANDEARLQHAFLTVTARPPEGEEINRLLATLKREREHYLADPAAAEAFLGIGESPRNGSLTGPEHAAWTQIATLLLNLSETLTKR